MKLEACADSLQLITYSPEHTSGIARSDLGTKDQLPVFSTKHKEMKKSKAPKIVPWNYSLDIKKSQFCCCTCALWNSWNIEFLSQGAANITSPFTEADPLGYTWKSFWQNHTLEVSHEKKEHFKIVFHSGQFSGKILMAAQSLAARRAGCRLWSIPFNKRRKWEVRKLRSLLWVELNIKLYLRAWSQPVHR